MFYRCLTFDVNNQVGLIRLNRPEAGNALTPQMARELLVVANRCDDDPQIRAVVLTGNGAMFCAGGDLKAFAAQGDAVAQYTREITQPLHAAISCFNWMDAPVVGAINGTAAGGGFSVALTTDLAIAAESARFTMAYTRAGLSPDGSASYFLARLVGLRRAKEMALLNPVLTADQALAWGLVNRVVPDDRLLDEALELAGELAQGPTRSLGESKRLMLAGATASLEEQMERETRAIARLAAEADGREGVTAFIAKRPPRFAGSQ